MTKKIALATCILFMASSCVVKKKTSYAKHPRTVSVTATPPEISRDENLGKTTEEPVPLSSLADEIINTALGYAGVRYKFGGTTNKGMDCSGLMYVSFGEHDIELPRISYQMATLGEEIKLDQVAKGDLLFFKTGNGRRINHVGLVVAIDGTDVSFIHATTSRGVIVSSLREGYWHSAYVTAHRIL